MAEPKKVNGKWPHRIMVRGQRVSGTFETKAKAIAWEAEQRVTLTTGRPGAVNKTCTDAFEKYEIEVSKKKRGYRWEALRLAAFSRSTLGKVKMADLRPADIAAWRDERLKTVQGATITRDMNLLSNVFAIARKEWHWLDINVTADVARPKGNPPRDRRITPNEIETICLALGWRHDAIDIVPTTKQQRVALAFLWAMETAMRAGEICALRRNDVTGRVARLHITKNGRGRDVPLSPRALEIWKLVPDGFGLESKSLDALFRKARERSGIKGLTFHDTRHEAITRLASKLGVLDLARMVGHSDIRQLQAYYNATADDIASRL